MSPDRPRVPFTLINLVAVIVCIAVLVAMILSARQQLRHSRRMQCSSNLKQLGIALHNYHHVLGSFPSGMTNGTYDSVPDFAKGSFEGVHYYHNAFALLTSYMESPPNRIFFDNLDPHQPWYSQPWEYAAGVLSLLNCPDNSNKDNPLGSNYFSEFLPAMESWSDKPFTVGTEFALTDYLLCKGVSDAFCAKSGLVRTWQEINAEPQYGGFADNERGMFDLSLADETMGPDSSFACKISMIRDGLSNTFAMGEGAQGWDWQICTRGVGAKNEPCEALCWDEVGKPEPCSNGKAKRHLPIYQFWIGTPNVSAGTQGGLYMGSIFGCTLEPLNKNPVTHTVMETDPIGSMNCRASIDWDGDGPVNANTQPGVDRVSNFRSNHPGGANFLFADGSVRFIADDVDLNVYHALSTISGGESTEGIYK